MGWKLCLVGDAKNCTEQRIEVLELGAISCPSAVNHVGLKRATSLDVLARLQHEIVMLQEAALRVEAKRKVAISKTTTLKDYRARTLQTLFGEVTIRVPRIVENGRVCPLLRGSSNTRSTSEFDEIRTKISALMSFRSAMDLLGALYPVSGGISPATALRNVAKKAEALRQTSLQKRSNNSGKIALPLDTTYIRSRDTDSYHGHEILVGAAEQDAGNIHYFASPLAYKTDCVRLGKAAIATCGTGEIEAYSDSDSTVRLMARALGVQSKPISDWFHLAMKIQHVVSCADALEAPAEPIARANLAVQREVRKMRSDLWKGDTSAVKRIEARIRPHLRVYPDEPNCSKRASRVRKLKKGLKQLAKYVLNPNARIVDYSSRKLAGDRLGTSLVESAAEYIVNARMVRSQHMRWSKHGAYNLLQVRTADINNRLKQIRTAA